MLAPAIGPVLGGWLTDALSWHWVFLINLPVGVLSLVLVSWLVTDSPALKRDRAAMLRRGVNVDYIGFALVVLGFGALQIMLDRYEPAGGFDSPLVLTCGIVALVALSILVVWEIYHPQPVMNVRLFRPPRVCRVLHFDAVRRFYADHGHAIAATAGTNADGV